MKLGYLFIPPAGGQSRRPGHAAAMRAPLAKALGFSEFYAPLTPSEDTPGPHATERQSLLHILPNPPEQLRPQLVLVDGQSRDRGRPAPGPVAAPVSHAAQARMHSARGRAPLSVSWSDTDMLARHWAAHVTGCTHAGRCARPQDWRVARTVIVDPDGWIAAEAGPGGGTAVTDIDLARTRDKKLTEHVDLLADRRLDLYG